MQCQLPNKKAIDNTRNFLTELGAIDSNHKIQDVPLFLDVVTQLSQESNRAYGVQGQLWEINPLNNRFAIPNEKLLDQIDQIRKDQGLYEEQVAGSILDQISIALPDNFTNYHLKVANALLSNKVREPKSDKLEGFYNDLQKQGISNQQIELVKNILSENPNLSKEDIIRELLLKYTYTVEINTTKESEGLKKQGDYIDGDTYETFEEKNTSHYSNLTVPGGTNYTENEIAIPGVEVEEKPQGVDTKKGVNFVFEQSPELAQIGTPEQYSQYLDTIFPDSKVAEIDNSLYNSVLNQLEQENKIEKDCSGGKLKAKDGIRGKFTKGSQWEIYEIFEGKSHKQGGIDINIKNNQISFTNKNGSIKAKYGLVISKDN